MRHPEPIDSEPARIFLPFRAGVLRAHHRAHAGRHANGRVVRLSDPGTVLRWNPGASQNRLSLGKEERQSLAGCLLGREPLHRGGIGESISITTVSVPAEAQVPAGTGVRLRRPGAYRGCARIGDAIDGEVTHVEDDAVRRRCPLDRQPCRAAHAVCREIWSQVQRYVGHPRFGGTREGVRVGRKREYCRARLLPRLRRRRHAPAEHHQTEDKWIS